MDLALSLFQTPTPAPDRPRTVPTTTSNHFLSLLFFQESTSLPTAALINHDQLKNFQFFRKTIEALLGSMLRERNRNQLVILCPVQQSLMGVNALSKLEWEWGGIDEEFILSHIVRLAGRDRPVVKGLTVNTLNGRSLILTDTTVTTAKGFKVLKQARLVSEKIFYDNEGRGWVIHFIDRPLVGIAQDAPLSNPTSPKAQATLDIRLASTLNADASRQLLEYQPSFPDQETARSGRRQRQRSGHFYTAPPRARKQIQRHRSFKPAFTLQTAFQRFPGVSQKLEQQIMDFNDATMSKTSLEDIRSSVDRLLTDSVELLNQVDATVLSRLLDEYGATVGSLDQLLESHIMNSTYDIVFFKITLQLKQQDWDLSEAIRELRNLDLGQVGLPDTPQHYQCLVSALNEFQSIGVLRTPEEKLACLIQSIRVTSTLSGGADDLIPVLLLTVLRSGISNLASNLYYMKNFVLFGDASRGEYGYSLSTLEAVSRYILSHAKQLSPLSSRNQAYWEAICGGDMEAVKQIYQDQSNDREVRALATNLPRRPSVASFESGSDISINSTFQSALTSLPSHSRDAEGNNGVLLACKAQQPEMLQYLLQEQGASLDVANYEGKTPLMLAVMVSNEALVKIILRFSNESNFVDKQDVLGNSAMHLCVLQDNTDLLEELLSAKPDLGLANNEGDTPLIIAAKLSDRNPQRCRIVSILAEKMSQGDFDRQNSSGDTAIHFLVDPLLISDMVARGANPELDNYGGWTPLLKWALHDNATVVRSLLDTDRVDVHMTDSRGYTPLHMACLRGNLEMARMLLEQTPIDLQSIIDGSTPLQLACQSSSSSVVEYLLENGANPELRNWSNEAAADMTSDACILDRLDNAMLFWDSKSTQLTKGKQSSKEVKEYGAAEATEKRVIRVVRGTMEQDGKVRYIVKSGSTLDTSTIVTMPRSLDDFRFLRQTLLVEVPDACIPSLEHFYSPFLLSPSRPSKTILTVSARRLDMFLNYLSNHPVLANHELVWEFMLMPELQRDMIADRSQCKQENAIDSIFDNFPSSVDDLEHEETYFKFLDTTILQLDGAIQQTRKSARKLNRSAQDVPQQLDILANVLDKADQIEFDGKGEYVQALKAIASTQTMMHTSDIESLGNLFEDFSFVIDGTLRALQHPQEIIATIRQLKTSALKAEQSIKRSDMWWSGLSTIGEGAMTALGGAGAALGAVGYVATSSFGAVTSSSRTSSEVQDSSRNISPLPLPSKTQHDLPKTPSSPPLPPIPTSSTPFQGRRSSLLQLSPSATSLVLTPVQPRAQTLQGQHPSRSLSASILSSPFSSIASVASAATGNQMSLDEIKDKMGKASSLLNSLHGSLADELAHLQSHHTKELERAMRDFGARQLQIEKSRLRDMVDILSDLRTGTSAAFGSGGGGTGVGRGGSDISFANGLHLGSATAVTSGVGSTGGSQLFSGSTRDVMMGMGLGLGSRKSSFNALGQITGAAIPADGHEISLLDSELALEDDEKAEARMRQRQYDERHRPPVQVSRNSFGRDAEGQERQGGTSSEWQRDDDTLSEKIPFDD